MLHTLSREHFGASCIVHSLEVADHVGEPDGQAVVAKVSRKMESHKTLGLARGNVEREARTGDAVRCASPSSFHQLFSFWGLDWEAHQLYQGQLLNGGLGHHIWCQGANPDQLFVCRCHNTNSAYLALSLTSCSNLFTIPFLARGWGIEMVLRECKTYALIPILVRHRILSLIIGGGGILGTPNDA